MSESKNSKTLFDQAQDLSDRGQHHAVSTILQSIEDADLLTDNEKIKYYILQSKVQLNLGQLQSALKSVETANSLGQTIQDAYSKRLQDSIINHGYDKPQAYYIMTEFDPARFILLEIILAKANILWQMGKSILLKEILEEGEILLSRLFPLTTWEENKPLLLIQWCRYYWLIANYEKYLQTAQSIVLISSALKFQDSLATGHLLISDYFWQIGDYASTISYANQALKIFQKIDNPQGIIDCYTSIGSAYSGKGELTKALNIHSKILPITEETKNKRKHAVALNNIGSVHYRLGELEIGLSLCQKSHRIYETLESSQFLGALPISSIIEIYAELGDCDAIQPYLSKLGRIAENKSDIPFFKNIYQFCNGLFLRTKGGARNMFRAAEIFKSLISDETVESQFVEMSLIELSIILFQELKNDPNYDVVDELQETIDHLAEVATKNSSLFLIAYSEYFTAKICLLRFQLLDAQQYITHARNTARKHQFERLEQQLSHEHDQLLINLPKWAELKDKNAPLTDRLSLLGLETDLKLMKLQPEITPKALQAENPVLFSIITPGGKSIYNHFFTDDLKNKVTFSCFMTAFTDFGKECFAAQLDRISFGDNTILISPIENKSLCYVIKGQSYLAQQKLEELKTKISENADLLNTLDSAIRKNLMLSPTKAPALDGIIKQVFITRGT